MISWGAVNSVQIWPTLTRLGEVEIILPAAGVTAIALFARSETRRLASRWMMFTITAAVFTTVSKLAFIGWGIGLADINFTGVSGHAMFAAAIYPILMVTLMTGQFSRKSQLPLSLGCALVILVGLSRIELGAHSWSEVLAGLFVGGAVSAMTLAISETSVILTRPILTTIVLAWVTVMPFELQASQTTTLVERLAVAISGNQTPFNGGDLMRHIR